MVKKPKSKSKFTHVRWLEKQTWYQPMCDWATKKLSGAELAELAKRAKECPACTDDEIQANQDDKRFIDFECTSCGFHWLLHHQVELWEKRWTPRPDCGGT